MKPLILLASLSTALALPGMSAETEMEKLQALCQQQQQTIRQLESRIQQLEAGGGTTAKPVATAEASGNREAFYIVKDGDSLEKIAKSLGCSAAALGQLNGLKSSTMIHPGMKLKIPEKPTVAAANKPAETSRPTETAAKGKTHIIQAEDTFSSISRKYRIPVDTLIAANPNIKPTALRPGMVIQLGTPKAESKPAQATPTHTATEEPRKTSTEVVSTQPTKTAPQTAAPAPAAAPATEAPVPAHKTAPSNGGRRIQTVKVEEPMTYGQFATKYGTSAERLNELNALDLTQATVLAKGSELYVPAQP